MNFYLVYYILGIAMLPGIIFGLWAQIKVSITFHKYHDVATKNGKPAKDVARFMLDGGGCFDTKIALIHGELTDNYNPTTNTISLSDSVYNNNSVASVGVTAHEIGHVFQHKSSYSPVVLRGKLVKIINVLNYFVWPLIIIGLLFELFFQTTGASVLLYIGIGIYALNTAFCLITLPVELNASKRAYKMLVSTGVMNKDEAEDVKKVLNAAALTHIAALITSVLSLLRLVLTILAIRRN